MKNNKRDQATLRKTGKDVIIINYNDLPTITYQLNFGFP